MVVLGSSIFLLMTASLLVMMTFITVQAGADQEVLDVIFKSLARQGGTCVTVVEAEGLSLVEDVDLPVIHLDLNLRNMDKVDFDFATITCPFFIFYVDTQDQIVEFAKASLHKLSETMTFYVIVMRSSSGNATEIFEQVLPQALNLALIKTTENGQGFGVYRRDSCAKGSNLKGVILKGQEPGGFLLFKDGHDFSCKTIRATTFEYKPFVIIEEDANGLQRYRGIEMELFYTIVQKLGFNYTLGPPSDGKAWGNEIAPGVYSGLNGDIQHRRSDIGWANCFVLPDVRHALDFATYDMERICFMVKKPDKNPLWKSAVTAFDTWTWFSVGVMIATVSVVTVIYRKIHKKTEITVLKILGAGLLDVPQFWIVDIKSFAVRIFLIVFILPSFILTTAYRSAYTSTLSIPTIRKPIDTLEQLAHSPVPVATFSANMQRFLRLSTDPILMKLAERYGAYYDYVQAFNNASAGNLIMGEGLNFLNYNIRSLFTNRYGETDMHVMKECLFTFRAALLLQKNSPLKTSVDKTIQATIEAGMVQKWTRDAMDETGRIGSGKKVEAAKPWTLADLQVGFFLYVILVCCSLLAFISEVCTALKKKKKAG